MRVGDKVYCIKDIEFVSKYITTKVFVSGNVYIIYEIGDDSITIFNSWNMNYFFYITDTGERPLKYSSYVKNFDEYFITLRKMRKLKLDELGMSSFIERSFICEAIIGMEGLE